MGLAEQLADLGWEGETADAVVRHALHKARGDQAAEGCAITWRLQPVQRALETVAFDRAFWSTDEAGQQASLVWVAQSVVKAPSQAFSRRHFDV